MNSYMKSLGALVPLVRYICAVSPDALGDPIYSAEFAAGGGSFAEVSRDCNGNVVRVTDHPYQEVAGKITAQFSALKVGVAGGVTNARLGYETPSRYPNGYLMEYPREVQPILHYVTPIIGIETEPVGMEVGVLCSLDDQILEWPGFSGSRQSFSGGIRLGKKDKFHFSAGCAHNMP